MNIVATKLPLFEEIVENFLKKGKENILNQLADQLKEIDDKLCLKRPKSLKFVKYKQRSILTDFGMLTFKRRYYFDTLKHEYLYLLDYKLKIPKRCKVMTNIKLKVIEAASEMSYSKAAIYGAPEGYPLSKSTVYRYIKDCGIYIKQNNFIKDNEDVIHVQIDEKFLNILGSKNKKKRVTATIFKGRKTEGTKGRIKLENRTILSAKSDKELARKLNDVLLKKYKVKANQKIFVSGDLAQYIQQYPDKIWVCDSTYVPDKYHVKEALLKELGLVATDKELKNQKFIDTIIEGLKGTVSVDGIKLRTLLKRNPESLKNYTNTKYCGCSQEGMNSHYYASRFAKLPNKFGEQNLETLCKIIEAKQNRSTIKIGFALEYYAEPFDIIGHMWKLREDKFVLDTRGMKEETRKMFENIKYGW